MKYLRRGGGRKEGVTWALNDPVDLATSEKIKCALRFLVRQKVCLCMLEGDVLGNSLKGARRRGEKLRPGPDFIRENRQG